MTISDTIGRFNGRTGPFALTAAVHAALWWAWQVARLAPPAPVDEVRDAIQWILPAHVPPVPPAPRQRTDQARQKAPAPKLEPPSPTAALSTAPSSDPVSAPPAATPRLIDRLNQAKGELGKLDAEIRRERRGLIAAPADSPALRMQRKMAEAAELAPNKWYQAPKVSEIIDPGGYDRRRYKVVGVAGTYCITQESNHAPDGLDTMKNGIRPKVTNCPTYEQPATRQDW